MRWARTGEINDDSRGVSEVLGTALLIGFVVTAAILLLVMGGQTVDQVEEQNRVQSASQSFQQFASEIEAIRQSESESVEFQLPNEIANDVTTESRTRVSLYANGNTSCTTGAIQLQSLIYASTNGDAVGYEFGGVWEQTGTNSSSMIREPNIEYRDGRLAVSLSQMRAGMQGSSTISARLNESESRRMTANLTRSLFVNKTSLELSNGPSTPVSQLESCRPQSVENITVVIDNSRFATAWHNYALRNYDDRLVDVSPGEDAQVGSGDTVEITFKVQDTEFANFEVTDVDAAPSAPAGEDVSVDATVENTGDLRKTSDISFSLYREDGSDWNRVDGAGERIEDLTLVGGQVWDRPFTISGDAIDTSGTYQYRIDTGDDVYTETINIGDTGDDWPHFDIVSLEAQDSAQLSSNSRLNATVENTGDLTGEQLITFSFDGDQRATRTISLDSGAETTLGFDIPTEKKGANLELNVSSADDFDTTTISIGTRAYFDISDTRSPVSVDATESFEVNASITNTGDIEGTQTVELRVQNATDGRIVDERNNSLTLDGNLSDPGKTGGEVKTQALTVGGISDPGWYNYTVSTGSESVSKEFYVGEKPAPVFQVTTASADPNPVAQGNTTTVTAVINNTGGSFGEQSIELEFADGAVVSEQRSLAPGEGTTVEFDYHVPSDLTAGTYDYTVRSENTSVTDQLRVAADLSDAIQEGDGNGELLIDGNTTAKLQVLGTEPTGMSVTDAVLDDDGNWRWSDWSGWIYDPDDGEYRRDGYITRAPTVMDIVTENESAGVVSHNVWSGMDLNTPSRRDDQIERASYLEQTVTISEATSLWVSATTYGCDEYELSDASPNPRYVNPYGWYDRYYCKDWGGELVSTNSNQNTENVVILEDGEQVPSWGAATPDQRSIGDILDDKFNPDTGRLNIKDSQRVMLFELTQPNADPDNASPDEDGDPDYNDAVVLFEVVNRTRTVKTPARLRITDLQAPAVVDEGETDTLRVEVTNRGGQEASTDVIYDFDGTAAGSKSTGELDYDESTWLEVDLPPNTNYDPGTYGYEVSLSANPNQTQSGNVYVGSNPDPQFIVQGFERSYPRTVPQGSNPTVTATVANVGEKAATMPVVWSTDGKRQAAQDIGLSAGESTQVSFSSGISTNETDTIDFEVVADNSGYEAANSSKRGQIGVETAEFRIDHVRVGRETYNEDELILVTNLERLDALIENVASVSGGQNVTFTLENRSTGETEVSSASVALDGNDATFHGFDLGSWSNATGYYDYTIETEDDTFTGTIQIVPSADAYPEAQDPDYISIDMNVITFE